jgi:hypothetical protein
MPTSVSSATTSSPNGYDLSWEYGGTTITDPAAWEYWVWYKHVDGAGRAYYYSPHYKTSQYEVPVSEGPLEDYEEVEIREAMDVFPGLLFLAVPEAKAGKNRLHLDLRPDDHDAEVERLLALGARHVNIGQGEQSWVVLADPEGNEFCVLSSRGD